MESIASAKPRPRKQEPTRNRPLTHAEDLLETKLNDEDLRRSVQARDESRGAYEQLGQVGGGATLTPGSADPDVPQGETMGQTLTEGKQPAEDRDQVAREGRSASADPAAGQQSRKLVENLDLPGERGPLPGTWSGIRGGPRFSRRIPAAGGEGEEGAAPEDPAPETEAARSPEDPRGRAYGSAPGGGGESEQRQAMLRWLESIPDDPLPLLREKLRRDYLRQMSAGEER